MVWICLNAPKGAAPADRPAVAETLFPAARAAYGKSRRAGAAAAAPLETAAPCADIVCRRMNAAAPAIRLAPDVASNASMIPNGISLAQMLLFL